MKKRRKKTKRSGTSLDDGDEKCVENTVPEIKNDTEVASETQLSLDTVNAGREELLRLEQKLGGGRVSPGPSDGEEATSEQTPKRTRRRRYRPENTIRITLKQYWRLRDWMARRQLGLPGDYAGIFIQNIDGLVEPLVEPILGCIDAYMPEEWIVLIEEKSPILHLVIALIETEAIFGARVNEAKKELAMKHGEVKKENSVVYDYPKKGEA